MKLRLRVNGQDHELDLPPLTRLLDLLRDELGLMGTKEGCGEGECGACTVLLDREPVNSCLLPICQLDGAEVLTIEGLGSGDKELDPLQRHFIDDGAVQCGFCTPGMILAARALLDRNPDPSDDEIRSAIAGNLCRCTGYNKIIDSIRGAARQQREQQGAAGGAR